MNEHQQRLLFDLLEKLVVHAEHHASTTPRRGDGWADRVNCAPGTRPVSGGDGKMLTRKEHERVTKELDRARDRQHDARLDLEERVERERLRARLFGDPEIRPYNCSTDTIEARRRAQPPAEIPQRFEGYSLRAAVAAATPAYVPTKVLTGNEAYFETLKNQGIL